MTRFVILGLLLTVLGGLSTPVHAQSNIQIATPGATDDLRDALLASSLLFQASQEKTTDTEELLAAAQADYARILGVLYANARYGGTISISVDGREAAAIPPLSPPSRINTITMRVAPGPLYLFDRAEIRPLAQFTEVPEGFAVGQPAETDTITEAATAAVDAWRADGHAKAEIAEQTIIARHRENRLSASLLVAPGPRLRFGDVNVTGNRDVRTRRILTIAGLEEGRVFDPVEIERAVRRLRRTGSFRAVTIDEADGIGPNDTLPLTIGIVEQTPRRFGFGAEYSTVEGIGLSAFWLHRNFLGGAERFRVEGEISGLTGETGGVDYNAGIRYERPATPRADVDLFSKLTFEHLEEPSFTSDTGEFTLGFTRYATDELTVDFGLGYLYSDVTDAFGQQTYSLLTLPLGAVYERRNDQLDPTDGYFVDLEITPFHGLSGTSDGARLALDARGYESFGEDDRTTIAARVQLGALFGPSLATSPPVYRFFSGGGGTVRGQDYQSLAVDLGGGNESGGRSFLGLSAEVRQQITENIEVVGFADWGYIGDEEFPDFSDESHSGAGLGLRYNTSIGPIRFDVATPVSGKAPASNFYIYLGIGQAF
ncbi:MAG: outer membrane protein assembly factor [Silicimonas sp.]|nr:outer membrane protein assembly factor [Silicimonas sp.]